MKRQKKNSKRLERVLAVLALGILIIAWFTGTFRAEADLAPFLKQALPEAHYFEPSSGNNYSAWVDEAKSRLLGYVAVGTANGYGGELKIAVAVSLDGNVMGLSVVEHKETASFFQRVLRSRLSESLKDKSYSDSFLLGRDVDSVTGATYSSRALADSVRRALVKRPLGTLIFQLSRRFLSRLFLDSLKQFYWFSLQSGLRRGLADSGTGKLSAGYRCSWEWAYWVLCTTGPSLLYLSTR